MLETSIFLLHFSYIKACQSYRFFIAKKKKKRKNETKKKRSDIQLLMKLCKNAKPLIKEAPQSA